MARVQKDEHVNKEKSNRLTIITINKQIQKESRTDDFDMHPSNNSISNHCVQHQLNFDT